VIALAVLFCAPTPAHAVINNGENANDILGQFSSASVDTTADYVKGCPNNGASALGLNEPTGGTIDATNHWLFVSERNNNRVLVFPLNSTTNLLSSKTPTYVLGQPNFITCSSAATQSGMDNPLGLAVDSVDHLLYVADSANNRVLVFSTASMSNGMNATYELGQTSFTNSGYYGVSQSTFNFPDDIAYDSVNSRIFVADSGLNRVMIFNTSSITNDMNASYVLGQANFTTGTANQGGSPAINTLSTPQNLAYDSVNSRLFVADGSNARVMVFNVPTGTNLNGENAANVLGQANFTSNAGACTQSGMKDPGGLSYDATNNRLFSLDNGAARVLVFNVASGTIANGENAAYVLGEPNFTSCSFGGLGQSGMTLTNGSGSMTTGVIYDSTNSLLYVADSGNNRVMIFSVTPPGVNNPSAPTESGEDACAIGAGQLYCWGRNNDGEDGTGNSTEWEVPVQVGAATNWTAVSQGDHSFDPAACGIAGGSIYCWGQNTYGELGLGNTTPYNVPTEVGVATNWSAISTSGNDACAINSSSALYCWGRNEYGELGLGNTTQETAPLTVPVTAGTTNNLVGWWKLTDGSGTTAADSSGAGNTLTLTNTPTWITTGKANGGGLTFNGTSQVGLTSTYLPGITTTFTISFWMNTTTPGNDAEVVTLGLYSVCAMASSTNKLQCNDNGGNYAAVTSTTSVKDGNWHHIVFTATATTEQLYVDNTLEATASATPLLTSNANYQISIGAAYDSFQNYYAGSVDDVRVYNTVLTAAQVSQLYATSWSTVSTGGTDSCGITTGGSLYCWGENLHGELGLGSTTQQTWPQLVGSPTAANWTAVTQSGQDGCGIAGGSLYCWGLNSYGEDGTLNTTTQQTPVQVQSLTNWSTISQGDPTFDESACAISTSGNLYCWGRNQYGEAGIGSYTTQEYAPALVPTPASPATATGWTAISTSGEDTCGINTSTLWCWGNNNHGEDGLGNTTAYDSPQQVAYTTGPTSGLVGWWKLLDGAGSYAVDSSNNGNLGDLSNSPTWITTGPNGGGLNLGVSNSSVSSSDVPFQLSGSWTVSEWVNLSALPGSGATPVLIDKNDSATCTNYRLALDNGWLSAGMGWAISFNVAGSCGTNYYAKYAVTPTLGTWYLVTGAYDSSAQTLTLYVNGASVATQSVTGHSPDAAGGENLDLGEDPDGDFLTHASITDARVYNVALTAAQVAQLYATSWSTVSTGGTDSCGINSGMLYCWGKNQYGELGINNTTEQKSPVQVGLPTALNWTAVTQSGEDACGIASGHLYCWGLNTNGEDGTGTSVEQTTPVPTGAIMSWSVISQGDPTFDPSTCGITTTGTLYCWGNNANGEAGQGNTSTNYYRAPTPVPTPASPATATGWTAISTSGKDTCGINNGALYCWGKNAFGEVGNGNTTEQNSPVQIGVATTWTAVSTGGFDTCGINSGALYCWGEDKYGEAGQSTTVFVTSATYTPTQIATTALANAICAGSSGGATTALSLAPSGTYDAWLGTGSGTEAGPSANFTTTSVIPYAMVNGAVIASSYSSLTTTPWTPLTAFNVSETGGAAGSTAPWTNVLKTGVVNTAASTALKNCTDWSTNLGPVGTNAGLVGSTASLTSTWTNVVTAVTCASSEALYCFEQSGGTALTTPTQVGAATNWIAVSQGGYDTCGIRGSSGTGSLWCWGENKYGEDGVAAANVTPYAIPQQVGALTTWSAVTVQYDGTNNGDACGIAGGALYCWGRNSRGEAGQGNTTTAYEGVPTQVGVATNWSSVSFGMYDTCAVNTSNALYCWGRNNNYEDGVGNTTQNTSPVQVTTEYSYTYPTNWTAVSQGAQDTCGIAGGSLYCWGGNQFGELGQGGSNVTQYPVPMQVGAATNWLAISIQNDGSNESGDACGIQGSSGSGSLWCWGSNFLGEDGLGNVTHEYAPQQVGAATNWSTVSFGYSDTCAVNTAGQLWCWGQNNNYEDGLGYTGVQWLPVQLPQEYSFTYPTNWLAVSQGSYDTCAIAGSSGSGSLYCWGYNKYGELGQGGSNTTQYPIMQQVGVATNWSAVTIQYDGTDDGDACAINTSGQLWCWGRNHRGEAGIGSTTQTYTPTQVTAPATTWASVSFGMYDTCGVASGQLYCWGYNHQYEDGVGTTTQNTTPQIVGGIAGIGSGELATDLLGEYNSTTSTATIEWTQNGPNNGPTALGLDESDGGGAAVGGVALDPVNHYLYVSDYFNNRVLVYALNNDNSIPTASGGHTATYVLGQTSLQGANANLGCCNSLTSSSIDAPQGLAFDVANSRLFVVSSFQGRVLVFDNMSTPSTNMAASYVLGQSSFTVGSFGGGNPLTQSNFGTPTAVAYDAVNQRLFVVDNGWTNSGCGHRVLVFNVPTGTNITGENASYVLGQSNFTNCGQATSSTTMNSPETAAFDPVNQRLFVADANNNRVLVFNVAPGTIANGEAASYELGQPSGGNAFTTSTGVASQNGLSTPAGLAYDAVTNRLFVYETSASVVVFNVAPGVIANGENAAYELGYTQSYASSGSTFCTGKSIFACGQNNWGPGESGQLTVGGNKGALFYDPGSGRLFVTDTASNRVMIFPAQYMSPWPLTAP